MNISMGSLIFGYLLGLAVVALALWLYNKRPI
jgi:hypothetical protein